MIPTGAKDDFTVLILAGNGELRAVSTRTFLGYEIFVYGADHKLSWRYLDPDRANLWIFADETAVTYAVSSGANHGTRFFELTDPELGGDGGRAPPDFVGIAADASGRIVGYKKDVVGGGGDIVMTIDRRDGKIIGSVTLDRGEAVWLSAQAAPGGPIGVMTSKRLVGLEPNSIAWEAPVSDLAMFGVSGNTQLFVDREGTFVVSDGWKLAAYDKSGKAVFSSSEVRARQILPGPDGMLYAFVASPPQIVAIGD
jgi:hypothetical protein